jgi:methyltransferase (TIGR00027 family)
MFKGTGRIVYGVSDLEKAKEWYRKILRKEPVFDSPISVIFLVGTTFLILAPRADSTGKDNGILAYWNVEDAAVAYKQLCELGATIHAEPVTMGRHRLAAVKDPFNNIIGVMNELNASEKTVEQKPSDTARAVANMRFLATLDQREEIRGPDYLAEIFVPEEWKTNFSDPAKREWFLTKFLPPGMYLTHIARTAWFDSQFEEALKAHIPQIVFLGAGYDSRPYRFANFIKNTSIYEVDAPPTQEHKRSLLEQREINIPGGLVFVPTNFNNNSLKDALFSVGFDKKQKTLYVWEGVTYYLPAQTIDDMFNFIRENSPPGSIVCFDYYGTFPGIDEAYGVKEQREFMKTNSPGECIQFRIVREKIGTFLSERGYKLTEHLTPEEAQKRYLTLKDGSSAGKISAGMCFVQAITV